MDLPKKNEWEKFRHSLHSQIEDDGKQEDDTATTISEVTERTGLGDMAKDVINNISRTYPKRAFNMFQSMIQDDNVYPSQTLESEQDNSFLGFHHFINSCINVFAEAFNLYNINIPKTWVLLDNRYVIHLFCNPNHPWISNVRSGPGVMNIQCNTGIANTKTIAGVANLDR